MWASCYAVPFGHCYRRMVQNLQSACSARAGRRTNKNHSLHIVDAGACRTSTLDDGNERTSKADAEGELQRLWLQLARMLPRTHVCGHHTQHTQIQTRVRPTTVGVRGRRQREKNITVLVISSRCWDALCVLPVAFLRANEMIVGKEKLRLAKTKNTGKKKRFFDKDVCYSWRTRPLRHIAA